MPGYTYKRAKKSPYVIELLVLEMGHVKAVFDLEDDKQTLRTFKSRVEATERLKAIFKGAPPYWYLKLLGYSVRRFNLVVEKTFETTAPSAETVAP